MYTGIKKNEMLRLAFRRTLAVLSVAAVCACSRYGAAVDKALRYAGDNRAELEKVLDHYRQNPADSQKYRAAEYLIRHMPYHTSYSAESYYAYCDALDSLFSSDTDGDELLAKTNAIAAEFKPLLNLSFDIQVIEADYLIWNIDYSFTQWQTLDYLRHLRFEDFCEYILPYKCAEKQPLDTWKRDWVDFGRGELDYIGQIKDYKFNARRAAEAVNAHFEDSVKMQRVKDVKLIEVLRLNTLAKQPYGDCFDRSRFGLLNCRSKGIPVAFDFTPNWPDRSGGHYWNNILATKRRNIDYEPFRSYPGSYHYTDNGLAKVFRETYAPHPLLLEALEREGSIPKSLSRLFMKDVTDEYGRTVDISVPLSGKRAGTKYAYLAVFDNSQWVPVDIGRIRRNRASFTSVGRDILYLVVGFRDGTIVPISEPFIVDSRGDIAFPHADTTRLGTIRLDRKFPAFSHIYSIKRYLQKGRIQAADNPGFRRAETVAELPEWNLLSGEIAPSDTLPRRYWRLMSSSNKSTDFAELYFYEKETGQRITGTLFSPAVPIRNPNYDTPGHINDNDPLTYFAVQDSTRWVGFDFGKPVALEKIAYIRRGDGNAICPGDEYGLYYWQDGGWKLLERKKAERIYIDFGQVPLGGLYYIKGLSRGEQDRVFLYEAGAPVWY